MERGRHSRVWLIGPFAVKIFNRNVRANAKKEFKFLKELKSTNIAPKPLISVGPVLVMTRITGKSVKEMSDEEIKSSAPIFLKVLHELDKRNIMKEENHRPGKHFILTRKGPKLIDFERAHEGKGNVTQFMGFLRKYFPGIEKLGPEYKKTQNLQPVLDFILASK